METYKHAHILSLIDYEVKQSNKIAEAKEVYILLPFYKVREREWIRSFMISILNRFSLYIFDSILF